MWLVIQQQQAAIAALERKLAERDQHVEATSARAESNALALGQTQDQLTETRQQLEITADTLDGILAETGSSGTDSRTQLGGYGELHYNNLDSGSEIDFHRFVMFVGHRFSDSMRLFTEIEVEHSIAGDGQNGEVEIEQAYLQWDYAEEHNAKGGLFLVPVGLINETHEPDTFYGVERNEVEKNIIPATWWEAGVAFGGELSQGWNYDLAVHSGLNLDTGNPNPGKRTSVRSARQKVSQASAENLAYTGRLRYSGIPGFRWSLSAQYQDDVTQSDNDNIGIGPIDGLLLESHLVYASGNFEFRGLYARWSFDERINQLNAGADQQTGWFLEPSYRLTPGLGVFARYSRYDTTAGSSSDTEMNQINAGLNYWPDPRVVLKFDLQRQDNAAGNEDNGFNLGIGYSF